MGKSLSVFKAVSSEKPFIVDPVITYTLNIGAVRKPHLPGVESVYLFFEFTIINS